MEPTELDQFKAALAASPDNIPLLLIVLKACMDGELHDEALALIEQYQDRQLDSAQQLDFDRLRARCYLELERPEDVTGIPDQDDPQLLILKARAWLDCNEDQQAREAYTRAVTANATLEDPALKALIFSRVAESEDKTARLRVIDCDREDDEPLNLILEPAQQKVLFRDVGGLAHVKKMIHKKIILPYQKPSLYQRFRKRVGGGILLYGPPGCGKTLLARATAGECNASFFNISISDVLDMYIGESERKLQAIFEKARSSAPAVLFFDEVEALGGKRQNTRDSTSSKLVSQFLSEMDGFAQNNQGILILAATNVPWSVDPAFRRPGRFDRVLFVPPPDREARKVILDQLLAERPAESGLQTDFIAKSTSSWSGADLAELVETAADLAIEESIESGDEQPIRDAHLKEALKEIRPTTQEWLTTARNYARYSNEGGQYDEVLEFLNKFSRSKG